MPSILPDLHQTEAAIIRLTNEFRRSEKLGPLDTDPALTAAARAFAQYIAKTGAFSHTADGQTPSARAKASGYQSCRLSENLAMQADSLGFTPDALAKRAVDGWIKSPGHRANLLTHSATDVAVAVVQVPDRLPKYVTVQLLGRPQRYAIKFSITNRTGKHVPYAFGAKHHEIAPRTRITQTTCDTGDIKIAGAAAQAVSGTDYIITEKPGGALSVETQLSGSKR